MSEPAPHLVLVGLPGVGKTTVGRLAAARLGMGFLDFDEEIERREGLTVSRIFSEHGERHFRALERALTAELRRHPAAMILAPGGGWIENADVVALLRPPARLVYLKASPRTVLDRLGSGRSDRPLLAGADPEGALARLYERRRDLYEGADHVLDTELLGVEKVMDAIAELVTVGGAG